LSIGVGAVVLIPSARSRHIGAGPIFIAYSFRVYHFLILC
jgi:hypothetical protein